MKFLQWTLVCTLLVVSSCSNENESSIANPNSASDAEKPKPNVSSTSQQATISFFPSLNICDLLPSDLVAATIGGAVKQQGHHSDYGNLGKTCTYGIKPVNEAFEHVAIGLAPPGLFQKAETILETDRGLGQQSTAEVLQGLGDEAFVIHNQTEEQSTIHVLNRNAFALSVTARNLEHARPLTELALARIKP